MNRALAVCLVLCLISFASGDTTKVRGNPKNLVVSSAGETAILEGRWQRISPRVTVEIPDVNAFRIECSKQTRICREFTAKFITPSDDPLRAVSSEILFLMNQDFMVTYWRRDKIRAKAEPSAADIYLEISLLDSTAMRTSQGTEKRGARGVDSTVNKWSWR